MDVECEMLGRQLGDLPLVSVQTFATDRETLAEAKHVCVLFTFLTSKSIVTIGKDQECLHRLKGNQVFTVLILA